MPIYSALQLPARFAGPKSSECWWDSVTADSRASGKGAERSPGPETQYPNSVALFGGRHVYYTMMLE